MSEDQRGHGHTVGCSESQWGTGTPSPGQGPPTSELRTHGGQAAAGPPAPQACPPARPTLWVTRHLETRKLDGASYLPAAGARVQKRTQARSPLSAHTQRGARSGGCGLWGPGPAARRARGRPP